MAGEFKISFSSAKTKTKPGLAALGLKSSSSSTQPPAKRLKLLGDDEPEDKDTHVEISGWDTAAGGAVDANGAGKQEEKKVLVIPAQPNRNWRDGGISRGRGGAGAPPGKQESEQEKADVVAKAEKAEGDVQYGLTILKKPGSEEEANERVAAAQAQLRKMEEVEAANEGLTEDQRLEKRALEALLNDKATTSDQTAIPTLPDEDAAFSNDYDTAPDAPSLDDYEAVPVEGFGAALLRGMGWKDGEEIGRKRGSGTVGKSKPKPPELKRRAEFLGIGAKADTQVIGGKEAGWARGKEKPTYQPVVLKNKVTGEVISEEELKRKVEAQGLIGEGGEKGEGRDRDREKRREKETRYIEDKDRGGDDERRRERKRRDRDDYRNKDRDKDRDRDRRREEDSRDRRDKDKDRDRDSRRKDRRREDDYHDDRKKDSSRRGYDYSDDDRRREKRRDRDRKDRSRSRDSDDRRKRRRDYDDEPEDRKRRHRDDGYRR